jgi:hypothetical protein
MREHTVSRQGVTRAGFLVLQWIDMRLLPICLIAFVTSCNWLLDPGEPGDRQILINELNRREALWEQHDIHDYDFDYRLECECLAAAIQPVRIEVRKDTIARVLDAAGAEIAPTEGVRWPTVDSLFLWTRDLANNRSYTVEVGFDGTLDFPNFLRGDVPQAVDDEFIHRASNLVETTLSNRRPGLKVEQRHLAQPVVRHPVVP